MESSWQELIHMGGYGYYVWPAYGLVLVVLFANFIIPFLRERRTLRHLARRGRRRSRRA